MRLVSRAGGPQCEQMIFFAIVTVVVVIIVFVIVIIVVVVVPRQHNREDWHPTAMEEAIY